MKPSDEFEGPTDPYREMIVRHTKAICAEAAYDYLCESEEEWTYNGLLKAINEAEVK